MRFRTYVPYHGIASQDTPEILDEFVSLEVAERVHLGAYQRHQGDGGEHAVGFGFRNGESGRQEDAEQSDADGGHLPGRREASLSGRETFGFLGRGTAQDPRPHPPARTHAEHSSCA